MEWVIAVIEFVGKKERMMKVTKCLYCDSKAFTRVTKRADDVFIIRCNKCKVMMVDTLSDNTADLYTREYFEKEQETDHGYATYMSSPTINLIGKYGFSELFSNGNRHLDLGCADGSLMEIFSQYGYKSHGLEISSDAVEVVRKKGLQAEVSNLHTFPESLANSVDVMTAFDLLEHVDRPGLVLKNIYHALSDDGVFVFSTLSVKSYDETDYWFNNSLEHYIYYDHESLTNVMTETFGEGQFGFVEETINGISEFWGFATKGEAKTRHHIMSVITNKSKPRTPQEAYNLSLFLNQVSDFDRSHSMIEEYKKQWTDEQIIFAQFANHYLQGHLEKALQLTSEATLSVPSINGIFWRGYYQAEHDFSKIKLHEIQQAWTTEALRLQEELFRLNDKYQALINSRIVGRVIKGRDIITGKILPQVKSSPRNIVRGTIHNSKRAIGIFLPMSVKVAIGKKKRSIINELRGVNSEKHITYVMNEEWDKSKPIVSIVVPYYNRHETIDQTMESLIQQTFTDFETIIVNDGSSDKESVKKFSILKDEYKQLSPIVISQDNQGVSVARNTGIEKARGKYIICLDSDDILDPTYIEKAVIVLETDRDVSLVTSYRRDFGARNEIYESPQFDPRRLFDDNMVTTAAVFRRSAWEKTKGYKPGIGYEDWEFWIQLAKNGDWGKTLKEPLFKYRVALQSRFMDDKTVHRSNIKRIHSIHSDYKSKINTLLKSRKNMITYVRPESALLNINDSKQYSVSNGKKPSIMIVIPWMTFGGAETLLYNFCRPLKDKFDITFVTGEESSHEWEYKFREITDKIFHLPQLIKDQSLYGAFISNYIRVHDIDIIHIVHSGYLFDSLPLIKRENPNVKIAVTMFNDRVDNYVAKSIEYMGYIDSFNTDSKTVAESFAAKFEGSIQPVVIPNGVDCHQGFAPDKYDRMKMRKQLDINHGEIAVVFLGRLSPEKNPDVFIEAAGDIKHKKKMKFFIIGDGPMNNECRELVENITDVSIEMLGYQENIPEYLSAMDIFVLPSSIEGFPLSILESYAMGLAVVASRVGAVPDVVEDGVNGYTVEPGSKAEIAKRLDELAVNAKLLADMKQKNREVAESKYSIERLSSRYSTMYKGILP